MERGGEATMSSGAWATLGVVIVAIGTVVGAFFTWRSAKSNTVVTGFAALTTGLEKRVERLEAQEIRRSELAQLHRPWDISIYDQARAAGWAVSPPPPLD
jgi:hypothetical protein